MKHYWIVTTYGEWEFNGKYLKDREKPNWHYYQNEEGEILHFRKEHMVVLIEKEIQLS